MLGRVLPRRPLLPPSLLFRCQGLLKTFSSASLILWHVVCVEPSEGSRLSGEGDHPHSSEVSFVKDGTRRENLSVEGLEATQIHILGHVNLFTQTSYKSKIVEFCYILDLLY